MRESAHGRVDGSVIHHEMPPGGAFGYLATDDGVRIRHAAWRSPTARPRGTILILTGRSEFVEKYLETIGDLLSRGYDVFIFDWRGQGRSSRLIASPTLGHVDAYEHYVDDLAQLVERIVRPQARGPLSILAHSMGGHIAIRYLATGHRSVEKAILCAPMFDIHTEPVPRSVARLAARTAVRLGKGAAPAFGKRARSTLSHTFETNPLTSDPTRFDALQSAVRTEPNLALGAVTFGWLDATLRSIDVLHAPGFAESIATQVLICQPGRDRIVRGSAQDALAERMPNATLIRFPDARHELLIEADPVRNAVLEALDAFVG